MPLSVFRPDALRQHRLFESSDLDETRESISRVMQPHALRPTGRAEGTSHMDFVKVGRLGLGTIGFGSDMDVAVESVDGYYLLMFCIAGRAAARTRGMSIDVDRNTGILCGPGQSFEAQLSDHCEQFVLRIDAHAFAAVLGDMPQGVAPLVPLGNPLARDWVAQLQLLTGSPDLLERAQTNPRIASHMESLLIELLVDALGSSGTALADDPARGLAPENDNIGNPRGAGAKRIAPAFVLRAEAFVRAHSGDALQLQDIATAAGVPSRTLRDAFQHFRGVTPMQFVRDLRMAQAREALLRAGPNIRVADIALACGFLHLGRFSLAYASAFGESPSDTLRRQR